MQLNFFGDYHTHTVFSHGKSSIEENVLRAINLGLKEIAITDHGFKHMTFNVRRSDWAYICNEADIIKQKYPQINIYLGLETNFNSNNGNVDIISSDMDKLDLLVCGYHKFVRPARFSDIFSFYLPNFISDTIGKTSVKLRNRNTDAYIKALEKYQIDIISHPNYSIKVDIAELAKACVHYGTYLELNGKRINMTDNEIDAALNAGANFIANSDAHYLHNVGNFDLATGVINKLSIPHERIANLNKCPDFRSDGAKKKSEQRKTI